MANNKTHIIEQLRNLRLVNGYSFQKLAKLSGLGVPFLIGMEKGKRVSPKLETLEDIAGVYGLSIKLTLFLGEFETGNVAPPDFHPIHKATIKDGMVQAFSSITPEQNAHVVKIAQDNGVSRSEAIRRVIQKDIDRERDRGNARQDDSVA